MFYEDLESEPVAIVEALESILDQCYTNSEYFALTGAAYLEMVTYFEHWRVWKERFARPEKWLSCMDFAEVLYGVRLTAQLKSILGFFQR